MTAFRKVVWAEGVMLGQQHFQQWERYLSHEKSLDRLKMQPYNWGLSDIRIDEALLSQGQFSLSRLSALMPDRRWVKFDALYDGNLDRPLPDGSPQKLSVYLGLAASEQVDSISGYHASLGNTAAWQGEYQTIHDLYDSSREREVLLAKQKLALYFEGETSRNMTLLKIAELEFCLETRAYRLSTSFIPAVMSIAASPHFSNWLAQMVGELSKYIKILSEQKEKHRHAQNQFGYADFIYFNLIKTLSTHLAQLAALQKMPAIHPLAVYQVNCALLGELAGYLEDPLQRKDGTAYQQQHLSVIFNEIKMHFVELMDSVMPANTIDIPLQKMKEHYYLSGPLSLDDLKQKQFCLALHHEQLTDSLIEKVKSQVKMTAPSKLEDIVLTFTKGVGFDYLTAPGKDLLAKRNYHYFMLDKQDPGWKDILAEERIAFFVSKELANCAFELISY